MLNPPLNSPHRWGEDDEFNLLTEVLKITTESAESYDPSINLFDRISKTMNKSLGYEEILNKVRDLQQRYHSHNTIKKDRIFKISDEIWGSKSKNGESDEGGCKNVIEKREMEEETEVEDVHLVRKCRKRVKQEEPEEKSSKGVKQEESEQRCRKRVKQEESEQKCLHCETKKTPQWRIGPTGPRTLCNACGIQYNKGRLEPDNQPTLLKHSKPVKKVLELRQRRVEIF